MVYWRGYVLETPLGEPEPVTTRSGFSLLKVLVSENQTRKFGRRVGADHGTSVSTVKKIESQVVKLSNKLTAFAKGEHIMRRVPSVKPEDLRTLCKQLEKDRGSGVLNHSEDVPLCVRYLEARRWIAYVRLLPESIQKPLLRFAATRPLESDLSEMIEEVIAGQASSRVDLQNPTQPVIL
jgi:hypothetical protein